MELKHNHRIECNIPAKLLIVPYGIETTDGWFCTQSDILLIVPYGIETQQNPFAAILDFLLCSLELQIAKSFRKIDS